MSERRFEEIETKLAFQEHTVSELNQLVYKQQKELDQIRGTCKHLMAQLKDLGSENHGSDIDEKPPHY